MHFRTLLAVIWKSLAHWPINFCISHKQGAILAGNFHHHFYLKLLTHLLSPAGVAAHPTDPTFEVKLRPTEQSRLKQPAALLRSDWSIRSCAGVLRCHWPALSGSRHIAHTSHRDRERGGCWRSAQPNWPRVEQGPTKWLTGHGDKAKLDDGRYLSTFYSKVYQRRAYYTNVTNIKIYHKS